MHDEKVQSVLRCGLCKKPFDQQSTLKRHGYYCRSRRAGSTTRSRSCISCARRKARCDNRRPECSRCIAKGIECHYPANTPKGTGPRAQHDDNGPTKRRKAAPPFVAEPSGVDNRQERIKHDDVILDSALVISDPEFANPGMGDLDWDDLDISFADFLNPQTNDKTVQYPSSGSSSSFQHSAHAANQTIQVQPVISFSPVSIPAQPTHTPRLLIQRPKMKTGVHRIANLIQHTMKSYLLVMLRHNTLPPFIHPHLISSDVENNHMWPLLNCISLVHMISHEVQGSRHVFWVNVRLECERLCAEHSRLNKWELLAAMQALSIYILIRLYEGETAHNNLDFLLLATVTTIAKQITCSDIACNTPSAQCNYGHKISWKDWIFEESRRRLSVVYRVVNMLFYFEPAAMCDLPTDLVLAPLPAKKQLWEASDELDWRAENEKDPGVQTAFGLAANGELVKLGEERLYCSDAVLLHKSLDARTLPRSTANWEEWCSGMDGFGGLVMLVASLIV